MDEADLPLYAQIVALAIPAILAITLHEAAHGYAALLFGDPTAKERGRLSLNPIRHVDPFGTIILPGMLLLAHVPFLLGWAKPVPVNFARLRHPRRDMVWVALAGPAMNAALALILAALFHTNPLWPESLQLFLAVMLLEGIRFNVMLGIFNMIPLPPLDGGRVAVGLLPLPLARGLARLEKYGILLLVGILIALPWLGQRFGVDLNLFSRLVLPIVDRVVEALTGLPT